MTVSFSLDFESLNLKNVIGVFREFQGCFKGVLRGARKVSGVFQGCFKEGCLEGALRVFQGNFMGIPK